MRRNFQTKFWLVTVTAISVFKPLSTCSCFSPLLVFTSARLTFACFHFCLSSCLFIFRVCLPGMQLPLYGYDYFLVICHHLRESLENKPMKHLMIVFFFQWKPRLFMAVFVECLDKRYFNDAIMPLGWFVLVNASVTNDALRSRLHLCTFCLWAIYNSFAFFWYSSTSSFSYQMIQN